MNLKSPTSQADNFYKITDWSTIAWATNNNWEIWHYIFILLVGIINKTQNLITLKLSIISNDVLVWRVFSSKIIALVWKLEW